jgi:AraC family carnitine catabolism transcriptional activator
MSDISDTRTTDTRTLGVLLISDFALMSYASIIEPYRAANVLAKRPLYRWVHISTDGRPVTASNGATILADQSVKQPLACETLFVIAGGDPAKFSHAPTFAWLRRLARENTVLVGVSGGPFVLARAGVLDQHRVTIHWEHWPAFVEAFPMLRVEPSLYVIDRRRVTCAGGNAGLDLAIDLIEREQGQTLAAQVSEWFIRAEPRASTEPQRSSLRDKCGVNDDRVLKVIAEMELAMEEILPREALAQKAGVSVRHLERLFVKYFDRTLRDFYMDIRLDQASQLLLKTSMSATSIAIACGFRSSSHFSRAFKIRFGQAPSHHRHR